MGCFLGLFFAVILCKLSQVTPSPSRTVHRHKKTPVKGEIMMKMPSLGWFFCLQEGNSWRNSALEGIALLAQGQSRTGGVCVGQLFGKKHLLAEVTTGDEFK